MHSLNVLTFSPKNGQPQFPLYILSKGLNCGKPFDRPTANCFVISCNSKEDFCLYKSICIGLWQTKSFYPYHCGSVIPYIRINDFKKVFHQALKVALKTPDLHRKNDQILKLEELEKTYLHNIHLINEAKKAIYLSYIRNKN